MDYLLCPVGGAACSMVRPGVGCYCSADSGGGGGLAVFPPAHPPALSVSSRIPARLDLLRQYSQAIQVQCAEHDPGPCVFSPDRESLAA